MSNNRFEHLKRKASESNLSREQFIEAAEKEALSIKPKVNTKHILLSVSGRINREKNCNKPSLVYLKNDIEKDMQKYCHGNKTLIINYLIRRGLDSLIEENALTLHMEEENNDN